MAILAELLQLDESGERKRGKRKKFSGFHKRNIPIGWQTLCQ